MKTRWIIMVGLVGLCGVAHAVPQMVTIGGAGNMADTTGYGAVGYSYQIGKYEVTIAEFQASGIGSGNENHFNDGYRTVGTNAPAVNVSWFEAAQYCNWLTSGDAFRGAYQFDGSGAFLTNVITRAQMIANGGLFYALPTEDEWYKAAYFKGGVYSLYANGNSTTPIRAPTTGWNYWNGSHLYSEPNHTWETGFGGVEQNGTYDMMGNVWEWSESAFDGTLDNLEEARVIRGGSWNNDESELRSSNRSNPGGPSYDYYPNIGIRVVAIPEPVTALSLVLGGLVITGYRRIRKNYGF